MKYLAGLLTITWKDITAEFRTKEMSTSMGIFALLVMVVFGFALRPGAEETVAVFPGFAWIGFFFAGLLGLSRSFVSEKMNGAMTGLMLAPVDRSVIYFGKVAGNLLFMFVVEAVSFPLYIVLFDVPAPQRPGSLALVAFLGTLGFVAVGTFLAALAANTRTSELLLPILLFPLAVPLVIAVVSMTRAALTGDFTDTASWWRMLVVYDAVFLVVPWLLFEYLLES